MRHGLADVLAWLGEPVGPRPGELTHVVALPGVVLLSPRAFAALRALADVSRTPTEGELVLVRAVYAARAGAA
ncbi:hypothetical protein [Cellulomonas gilvus]|uniref:hypothetical protein n=1 Tax=Cellulomonas gilvus TaxID=11 RepID=UPI0002F79019|nr:hypothetical protein [Cellulomonas gilvus]